MSAAASRPSVLGPTTGDPDLIARVEPLLRRAGLIDRVSVIRIQDQSFALARFGAKSNTVYEIGSVTKTMTSLLFAEAVESGELRADTTLGSLLDVHGSEVASVTLEELASHRSGLPRLPTRKRDLVRIYSAVLRHRNPYTADLRTLLAQAAAVKIAGAGSFTYSNLGAALLGQALAAHAGVSYPELLDRQLFTRLGMASSLAPLSADDLALNAPTGWSASGKREEAWTMNAYAPAGGVRSTPEDMTRYAQALLDRRAPGLSALEPRWDAGNGRRVGYAWLTDRIDGTQITWHNGATGGFSSMLALDRRHAAAVVILANTVAALDEIAIKVLLGTN
jgi:CubicO group peptidase (beta-lactamase class C family)